MIGKFEEIALLALMKAGPRAHAAKVYQVIENTQTKPPAFAALYTALDRMAAKGLVTEAKDATDKRAKRLFTISAKGHQALCDAVNATRSIEELLPGGGLVNV